MSVSKAVHAAMKMRFAAKPKPIPSPKVTPGVTPQLLKAINALSGNDKPPVADDPDTAPMKGWK